MPSPLPLPTVAQLRKAFHDGVRTFEKRSDRVAGSKFDDFAGMGALLFSRLAQRDKDLFQALYIGSAEGGDLTNIASTRYATARIVDAYGTGTVTLTRPNAGAGAGTFLTGTRIVISGAAGQTEPRVYAVTADTAIGATSLIATVPVRATVIGPGTAIDTTASAVYSRVDDVLWDPSWTVTALKCDGGTLFESAEDLRARVRLARINGRAGYRRAIVDACIAAGATNVALFASDFGGAANDFGINTVYVGDSGFTSTPALIRAVSIALESWRVCGSDLQVQAMATATLSVACTCYLWDDPSRIDTVDLASAQQAALLQYFKGREGGFAYRLDAMAGAMSRASSEVQSVAFASPSADLSVLVASTVTLQVFPATLIKWTLPVNNISITYAGPQ